MTFFDAIQVAKDIGFDAIEFIDLPDGYFRRAEEMCKDRGEGPEDCIEAIKHGREYLAKII